MNKTGVRPGWQLVGLAFDFLLWIGRAREGLVLYKTRSFDQKTVKCQASCRHYEGSLRFVVLEQRPFRA